MKKTLVALFLVLIMLVGMTPGSFAEDVKVLQLVWFTDGQEGVTMQGLIDEYEAANPGIEIEMVEVPYADLNNRIKTMLAAGEQPALARLTGAAQFKDHLVNLDEAIGPDFRNRFVETTGIIYDDITIAATMEYTAAGMVYNKDAFEAAGVAVPTSVDDVWTWEEFKTALQTVMEKSDVKYGLVVDKTIGRFMNFFYQAGASFYNEDMTAANIDTPEARKAFQFLYDLHKEGIIPAGVWMGAENPNTMFRSGQVAAHIGGSWLLSSYDKEITDFAWDVTYLPVDALSAVQSAGKYIGAFQGTGVEAEAAAFIEWLTRVENMSRYLEPNFFISNLVEKAEGGEESKYAAAFSVFSDEIGANASCIQREQANPISSKWQPDLLEMMSAYLADQISLDDLCADMTDIINEVIEDAE